jgi:hypothetical protein
LPSRPVKARASAVALSLFLSLSTKDLAGHAMITVGWRPAQWAAKMPLLAAFLARRVVVTSPLCGGADVAESVGTAPVLDVRPLPLSGLSQRMNLVSGPKRPASDDGDDQCPRVAEGDRIVWLSDDGPEYGWVRWIGHEMITATALRDCGSPPMLAGVEFVSNMTTYVHTKYS